MVCSVNDKKKYISPFLILNMSNVNKHIDLKYRIACVHSYYYPHSLSNRKTKVKTSLEVQRLKA